MSVQHLGHGGAYLGEEGPVADVHRAAVQQSAGATAGESLEVTHKLSIADFEGNRRKAHAFFGTESIDSDNAFCETRSLQTQ